MTVISFFVMIYMTALFILIGAFYWYGTRFDSNGLATEITENTEIGSNL